MSVGMSEREKETETEIKRRIGGNRKRLNVMPLLHSQSAYQPFDLSQVHCYNRSGHHISSLLKSLESHNHFTLQVSSLTYR